MSKATDGGEQTGTPREARLTSMTYCLVPRDLAGKLHEYLREHWREQPSVRVVVERRRGDRRQAPRRDGSARAERATDRRRVRNVEGRRVSQRRVLAVPAAAPPLPRRAKRHAERLEFVERLEPAERELRDAEAHRLVVRHQAGDESAFPELYMRYFDDVHTYARVALDDHHEAEDTTQQVFTRVLRALPDYELRPGTPFRAWLFRIARNSVINAVRKQQRVRLEAPQQIDSRREANGERAAGSVLDWLSDREVAMFVERLPSSQRQVLVLRFMLEMSADEIAHVVDRSPSAVRQLQARALHLLHDQLSAIGRTPTRNARRRAPMIIRIRPLPVTVRRRYALGQPSRARPFGSRLPTTR